MVSLGLACIGVLVMGIIICLFADAVVLWWETRKDMKYLEDNEVVAWPEEYVRERDRRR